MLSQWDFLTIQSNCCLTLEEWSQDFITPIAINLIVGGSSYEFKDTKFNGLKFESITKTYTIFEKWFIIKKNYYQLDGELLI